MLLFLLSMFELSVYVCLDEQADQTELVLLLPSLDLSFVVSSPQRRLQHYSQSLVEECNMYVRQQQQQQQQAVEAVLRASSSSKLLQELDRALAFALVPLLTGLRSSDLI